MSNKTAIINLFGTPYNITLHCHNYSMGNALAVDLVDAEGPFTTISTNLLPQSSKLPLGVFYCKDWSENETIIPQLVEQGIIRKRTDIPTVATGFVTAHAYEIVQ